MQRLKDAISAQRNRVFIGRHTEIQSLIDWLHHPQAPTTVFSLSGMGGIGKSVLMMEMLRIAQASEIPGIWIDGRSCTHTPTGFLDHVAASVMLETHAAPPEDSPLSPLEEASPSRRFVLCIDNYEALGGIESWLLEVFFPRLSIAGVLVVIASRQSMSLAWHSDVAWWGRVVEMVLGHFSRTESRHYLNQFDHVDAAALTTVMRITNGHPLALALTVEALQRQPFNDDAQFEVSNKVSGQLLRELIRDHLQSAIDVLTVTSVADLDLLNQVLPKPVTVAQYHELADLSFIRATTDGLALHDVARAHLLTDFRAREPERLERLRRRTATVLRTKLCSAEGVKIRPIAAQLLTLCLDTLPIRTPYADLTVDPRAFHIEPFRAADVDQLHKMMSDWCTYSVDAGDAEKYQRFLNEAVHCYPQCIRIIRGPDGTAIAMFILFPIYKATSASLVCYFEHEMNECYLTSEMDCAFDEVDSYYAVLCAHDLDVDEYAGDELVGALVRDHLTIVGEGARVSLVATNSDLKKLLAQLGFQLRPTKGRECDTSFAEAHVLELDLRHKNFGDWVNLLIHDAQNRSRRAPRAVITDNMVRDALMSILHPMDLENCALGQCMGMVGPQLSELLYNMLTNADVRIGLTTDQQNLLAATFLVCGGNSLLAAEKCNMSRATYYRHLSKAVRRLAQILEWNLSLDVH